jgi:hypothetical protein
LAAPDGEGGEEEGEEGGVKKDLKEVSANLRDAILNDHRLRFDGVAACCQSPIETAVFWALMAREIDSAPCPEYTADAGFSPFVWIDFLDGKLRVEPQHELTADGHRYRLDFLLAASAPAPTATGETQHVQVLFDLECDGHAYHERTKEQAKRDRLRDRVLQGAGYTVLRFTGSEIFADPLKVATEVLGAVRKALKEKGDAAYRAYREVNERNR